MLADFYIPRLSNDMKIAVQKNQLVGEIWYRILDPVKKTASYQFLRFLHPQIGQRLYLASFDGIDLQIIISSIIT